MLLLLPLFFLCVTSFWENDQYTGGVWNPNATIPSACFGTSGFPACCSNLQDPYVNDTGNFGTVTEKFFIALPASGVDYSATFLDQTSRDGFCPPFYGSIIAYTAAPANGATVVGSATMQWGGSAGICLEIDLVIFPGFPFCWDTWNARVGTQSIGQLYSSFPPLGAAPWMTATLADNCDLNAGSNTTIQLCPNDPAAGVTGTGSTGAQWPLMGCYQQVYTSITLNSLTNNYASAWVVPASANATNYYDATGGATPPCTGTCFSATYQITCYTSKGVSEGVCGTLITSQGPGTFILSFQAAANFKLSTTNIYLSNSAPTNKTGNTFSYSVGGQYFDQAYSPVPFISTTQFAMTIDLLRPVGSNGGPVIACNGTFYWTFTPSMTFTSGTQSTGVTGSLPSGSPQTSLSGIVYYSTLERCCPPGTSSACTNATGTCYNTITFVDNLNWNTVGTEFQTSRCCPLDVVLDVILSLLPESHDNTNSGIIVSNVGGTCISGPTGPNSNCTMSMTFLYEGAGYHNVLGYYFYNSSNNINTTYFSGATSGLLVNGLCSLWPDCSLVNSGGCMTSGDTLQVSIPPGQTVGWWVQANGWDTKNKAGTPSDSGNTWWSITDPPNGLSNADGVASHFAWLDIAGASLGDGGFIFSLEDLSGLGDKDFNDVIFATKLTGNWSTPGLPAYDPCTGTVLQCKTFAPFSYQEFIFTPGCINFITLDVGVGGLAAHDTISYYAIPAGWEIAPLDALGIGAAQNFSGSWDSPCTVGTVNGVVSSTGYNANGTCTATIQTISNAADPTGTSLCYNLGGSGYLLLRQISQANPNCNALTYGLYCSASGSQYYTNPSSSSPDTIYINLVQSNTTLTVPSLVPLYKNIQIFVLIDTYGIATSPYNEATTFAQTIQFLYNQSGAWQAENIGYGISNPSTPLYSTNCPLTYNVLTESNPAQCAPPNPIKNYNTQTNILDAVTAVLTANPGSFGWTADAVRYVYVPTHALPTPNSTSITAFVNAMTSSGIYVVFLPSTVSANSVFFSNLISTYSIPRCVVSSPITWPAPTTPPTMSTADLYNGAAQWIPQATTARNKLDGVIWIYKNATSDYQPYPMASAGPLVSTIPGPFGQNNTVFNAYPSFQYYNLSNGANFQLPPNWFTPNPPNVSFPIAIQWYVPEILDALTGGLHFYTTYISWNGPPTLLAPTLTYAFTDSSPQPLIADVVDSIRSKLDPNFNLLDVVFLTANFVSPTVPANGWVSTAVGYLGNDAGTPFALNTRFNIVGLSIIPLASAYGTWNLTYQLFDGCLNSTIGNLIITYTLQFVPPACQNLNATVQYGTANPVFALTNYISETPLLSNCVPVPSTTGTCPSATYSSGACTSCYGSSSCCAAGSSAGACFSASTTCPAGGAVLCTGSGCPASLTCNVGSCTASVCSGSTVCTGKGCPAGFQDGLFCVKTSSAVSVCCTQQTPSPIQIEVDTQATNFANINYLSSAPSTYSAITYGTAETYYNNLQFVPSATLASGNSLPATQYWTYRVTAPVSGEFATCTIALTVTPANRPPVISSTVTVTTYPGQVGTWPITISDPDTTNTESMFIVSENILFPYIVNTTTIFGVVNSTLGPTRAIPVTTSTTTGVVMLSGLNISSQPTAGTINFEMEWQPAFNHPYGQSSTFTLYAVDNFGAVSNKIVITLSIPPNIAPIFEGFAPGPIKQYNNTPVPITVQGSDPNIQDTVNLTLTIKTLPTLGSLTYNGVAVQVGQTIPNSGAIQSGSNGFVSNKTDFGLVYTPYSGYGNDSFTSCFTDTGGLSTCGVIPITITHVATPPTSSDESASTNRTIPVGITAPGYSVDSDVTKIVITAINFLNPSLTTLTYGGQNVTVGSTYTVTPGATISFPFTYTTTQYQTISDTFQWQVVDTVPLTSTATYTGTITGQPTPPQANDGSTTGVENTPVPITLTYGLGNNYYDPNGNAANTQVIIQSLPAQGNLYTTSGVAVGVGTVITNGQLVYQPPPNSIAPASFTFIAMSTVTGLPSNTATFSISLTASALPPVVTLTPPLIQVQRNSCGTFQVSTSSVNSNQITLYFENFAGLPFLCDTPASTVVNQSCSNFTLPATSLTATNYLSSGNVITVVVINNTGTWGKTYTYSLQWCPFSNYYNDNRTGTFQVYATDLQNRNSTNMPIGQVSVVPDNQQPDTPPNITSVTLIEPPNTCVFGCNPSSPTPPVVALPCNSSTSALTITVSPPSTGTLGLVLSNGTTMKITQAGTVSTDGCDYHFVYEPPTGASSTTSIHDFNATTGDGVNPYTSVPVTVCDVYGLCSSANVTILIPPVNTPPVTSPVSGTSRTDTLTIVGTNPDASSNVTSITIDSLNFTNPNTTLTYNGSPVMVGQVIPGNGTWVFNYTTNVPTANTDTFTYHVTNNGVNPDNLNSTDQTGTVTVPAIPPTTYGGSFAGPYGTPVLVTFVYGAAGASGVNYNDPAGNAADNNIKIVSVPANGTLTDQNGNPLGPGSIVPAGTAIYYNPPLGFIGNDTFTFSDVSQVTGLTANVSPMVISIAPPLLPPIISITPGLITVNRTFSGTFYVNVTEFASTNVSVYIRTPQLPFGTSSVQYSWFAVYNQAGALMTNYSNTMEVPVNAVLVNLAYADAADVGNNTLQFTIVWGPTLSIPDNTTGSFSLQAEDVYSLLSNVVTGDVAVAPNHAPFIISNDNVADSDSTDLTDYYSWTVAQDSWTNHTITLEGSDPDPWHAQVLTVRLLSLPDGVTVTTIQNSSHTLGSTDLPLDLVASPGADFTTSGVEIYPISGFFGVTSFTFEVIDLLGAVSSIQTVIINITHVNHPPTSRNETLYVYENSCVWTYCGAPVDISGLAHVQFVGFDSDPGDANTLTFIWNEIVDPSSAGTIGYYLPGGGPLTLLGSGTNLTRPDYDWQFWFNPATNLHSPGCGPSDLQDCLPFVVVPFQVEDVHGAQSPVYYLTIYVYPVNQPPVATDLVFYIAENTELVIYYTNLTSNTAVDYIPASDPDNTNSQISAVSEGISPYSEGSWYTSAGNLVATLNTTNLPGRYLKYIPPANTFSYPASSPLGTMFYQVYDLEPLYSPTYTIQVYVTHVPQPVIWTGPTCVRTLEQTPVLIDLAAPGYYFTNDSYTTPVYTLLTLPLGNLGTFYVCDSNATCTNITTVPYSLPNGQFYYLPPDHPVPNWGDNYTEFTVQLSLLDFQNNTSPISTINVTICVNVTFVPKPPVLVPLWFPTTYGSPSLNRCDEDTYFRFRFNGTSIDSPLDTLTAQIVTLIEPYKASLYVCGLANLPNGTGFANCTDGLLITTIEFLPSLFLAQWEISVVPYHNWNGPIQLDFIVWDPYLYSATQTLYLEVLPINDPPSVIVTETAVNLERYTFTNGIYTLQSVAADGTKFTLHDGDAVDAFVIEGAPITKGASLVANQKASQVSVGEANDNSLVLVNRLLTQIQDVDFYFGYNLTISGVLFNAVFLNPNQLAITSSTSSQVNCSNPGTGTTAYFNCTGIIGPLNDYIGLVGFPMVITAGAASGFGVFTVDDNGNIDKWYRPLSTSFTIQFFTPVAHATTTFPAAAIALIPVIAALSALVAAGAWIMFGNQAAAVASSNFDSFTVVASGGQSLSPIYDDQNMTNQNPLAHGHGF